MAVISTPHNAYKWLRSHGVNHENAVIISTNRKMFQYLIQAAGYA